MKKTALFLTVLLALFLRLVWLNRVPIAISDDELTYVFNAKAIFLSGKGLGDSEEFPQAEMPAFLISPFIGPLPFSLFSARLPYVFWGLIFLVTVYLMAKKLFGEGPALLAALITAINPWSLYFSRTTFDVPLAGTLYLIAIYGLVSLKGWYLLTALPVLILAFFSYIGTKIIFVPVVLVSSFYGWWVANKKNYTKFYFVILSLSLLFFAWFILSLGGSSISARSKELMTPFGQEVSQRVDSERHLSVTTPLTRIYSNKMVVWAKMFLEKYLAIFSTDFFFLRGEARAPFSLWTHGWFYYLDMVFLIFGFIVLFVKKFSLWAFFTALILIAPLPAALSTVGIEYSLRAVLIYPIFILLITFGVWSFINLAGLKARKARLNIAISLLVVLYFFQLMNFINIYFFRNPIYNSEGFGFSQRVLARYLNLASPGSDRVYVVGGNRSFLKSFIFYSGNFDQQSLQELRQLISEKKYTRENITFSTECPDTLDQVTIFPSNSKCFRDKNPSDWLSISQLGDGGEVYKIVNDSVCSQYRLERYPSGISFSDFKVEQLPPEVFCQKFISSLVDDAGAQSDP